mgnify:CR=1 FL=1
METLKHIIPDVEDLEKTSEELPYEDFLDKISPTITKLRDEEKEDESDFDTAENFFDEVYK